MSLVEFKNVYKRYKMGEVTINAVDGISFRVEEGEFAVSVMSGNGTVNEMDLALVRQETRGEDTLRVKAYTDGALTCGGWYANVSFDASVPVPSLVSALAGETVK